MRSLTTVVAGATIALLGLLLAGPAAAVTVTCPDPIPGTGTVRVITLDVAATIPATSCYASSDDDSIPLTLAGYLLLDKFGSAEAGEQADGALTIAESSEGIGTFSINSSLVSGFEHLILSLKDGNNASPHIEYFALGPAIFGGSWTIEEWVDGEFDKYKGFSTSILFGQACAPTGPCNSSVNPPSAVPIPAGLLLLGTALLGTGGIARWRRRDHRRSAEKRA